jgi:hypothetical protein
VGRRGPARSAEILAQLVQAAGSDRPDLRTTLLASQILGLMIVRYVLRLEPLASADIDTVVETVVPNFQRCLTGDL